MSGTLAQRIEFNISKLNLRPPSTFLSASHLCSLSWTPSSSPTSRHTLCQDSSSTRSLCLLCPPAGLLCPALCLGPTLLLYQPSVCPLAQWPLQPCLSGLLFPAPTMVSEANTVLRWTGGAHWLYDVSPTRTRDSQGRGLVTVSPTNPSRHKAHAQQIFAELIQRVWSENNKKKSHMSRQIEF